MSLLQDYANTLRTLDAAQLADAALDCYRLYFRKRKLERERDQHVGIVFEECRRRGMAGVADAMLAKAKQEVNDERLANAGKKPATKEDASNV